MLRLKDFKKLIHEGKQTLEHLPITRRGGYSLTILATLNSLAEGIGVATMLPILQFIEKKEAFLSGQTSTITKIAVSVLQGLNLSVSLPNLIFLCFTPILLKQLCYVTYIRKMSEIKTEICRNLRQKIFSVMIKSDLDFAESESQGRFISAVTMEVERAGHNYYCIFQLLWTLVLALIYMSVLFILSWRLTLLSLVTFGLVELIVRRQIRFSRSLGNKISNLNNVISQFIAERIQALRLIKMSSTESKEIRSMQVISGEMAAGQYEIDVKIAVVQSITEPILVLSAFTILYLAVTQFHIPMSELGIFLFILLRMMPLAKLLTSYRQEVQSFSGSFENLKTLLKKSEDFHSIKGGPIHSGTQLDHIVFDNVNFKYSKGNNVLHNASFSIPAKEITVVMGPSGSGKSTIIDLICRVRAHQSGAILVNGRPIEDYDLEFLRGQVALVSQQHFLFKGSLYYNLTYGMSDVSEEQLIRAARQSHAHEFINRLPQGYQTEITDRGESLSGGERQRICFARALLLGAPILILDEPFSALDKESEQYLLETLESLRGKVTILLITHNHSNTRIADSIYRIQDGKLEQVPKTLRQNLQPTRGLDWATVT